ncbi:MAG: hypothetical protein HYZ45_06910 [Burkholderiales bacterium]|nr:hypothetical protein [Burkholderiales bacterium]
MILEVYKRAKSEKYDTLRFVRADGSDCECVMPRQGMLPHDLVHFVVESNLPGCRGFLSLVAAGAQANFVMEELHELARAERAEQMQQAVQVEAVVEALQTQLWGGQFDLASFLYGCEMACVARAIAPLDFAGFAPQRLYDAALQLAQQWQQLPFCHHLVLEFSPCASA